MGRDKELWFSVGPKRFSHFETHKLRKLLPLPNYKHELPKTDMESKTLAPGSSKECHLGFRANLEKSS